MDNKCTLVADVFVIWAKDEQGVLRGFIARKDFKGLIPRS